MNVLIIYASHFGQTAKIASTIADGLRENGAHVDTFAAGTAQTLPAPSAYDVVVLGSRIEMGKSASHVVDYVRKYRSTLQRMPTAFFSVSMAAASKPASADPQGYMGRMFGKLAWHPDLTAAFAGGLPYRRYGRVLRFIMKWISQTGGQTTDTSQDHELTDWDAVRKFSDEVFSRFSHEDINAIPMRGGSPCRYADADDRLVGLTD